MKEHQSLYRKAIWTWFAGTAMFYLTLLSICALGAYLIGADLLTTRAIMLEVVAVVCFTLASLYMAWVTVQGHIDGTGGSLRQWRLEMAIQVGRKWLLYMNPVGLVCTLAWLLWYHVLIPTLRAVRPARKGVLYLRDKNRLR